MTPAALEAHLEPMLVGDVAGRFFVPGYQRGYRWGEVEVGRLLDDIWESRDKPYYLQPVVVKRHGEEWELVDGQQRLTTLYLVFQYMKLEGLQISGAAYSMRYETRPDSAAYLETLDPDESQRNIDFFHIHQAYTCISRWFESHGQRRQWAANKIYDALFDKVRVIWYEAADDVDATTLFTRLNVGRIPLTDAELVNASLLAHEGGAEGGTNRALEMAAEWDTIERDLREPEVWAFITGRAEGVATHISLLLDTIAGGPTGRERSLFHTFETLKGQIAEPQRFWSKVVDLYSLVSGWYADRRIFHRIGLLIADDAKFADLIELSMGRPKSEFEGELIELIRDRLNLTAAGLREVTYGSWTTASRALLLMNVETVLRRTHSTERYSFKEHAAGWWSLEHIHAQNAEQLNRAEQWRWWLELHRAALASVDGIDHDRQKDVLDRVDQVLSQATIKENDFRRLEHRVVEILSTGADSDLVELDSISNLALLHRDDNSALSNSVFAVKRAEILARDKCGYYIPVCTRNVFLKYYTPADDQQIHFWGPTDRQSYLAEMVRVLQPYLLRDEDDGGRG